MRYSRISPFVIVASSLLWAKGDMVLIEIKGPDLRAAIKITDPKIEEFNIWAGPGTSSSIRGEGTEGFIIDWKAGALAQPPAGLQHYRLDFYAGCRQRPDDPDCAAERPRLVYVVGFDYDAASKHGFVYLPRFFEPWSELNCGSICRGHGLEGHWFRATSTWERFVAPFLERARDSGG